MDKMTSTVAALALGLGMSLAVVGGAVAQPKEGCEISTIDEAAHDAGASEEHAAVSPETGRESGGDTDSPATGATAEAEGSHAPMPGMGECDEIDDLGTDDG